MTRSTRVLWLVHVVANVIFALLVWLWLGIPDARTWQLGVTALFGLAILFGVLWLHGSTFRYFSGSDPVLPDAFRDSLKRLPLFAVWAAVWIALASVVQRWELTRWVLTWIVIPAVLLPLAAAVMGQRSAALAAYKSPRYWMWAVVLLVVGMYVPYRLILWVPGLTGFALEAVSFGVRWLIAYLVFVTAWVMLAYVSSGGSPRLSQPTTASLP